MSPGRALDHFPPAIGEGPAERRRQITQQVITAYADASGDHNPIHLDLEYARRAGLPSTIAHGLLTLGSACASVEGWAGERAWVAQVSCRFSAPVPSGEELICTAQVTASAPGAATLELAALTSAQERALTKAKVELRAKAGT
ncbi:MAG: MaoC/PaaZ C-terminal domain-containing protein [Candidatus Dormiibacterota bacterium]